ncbi:FecR domain-containing protein [Hyphomicrobium sp. LHD-15]|uniref:FecR family protein n=1 Tax=Hyphomicrobium sp. LHD-15 TaxID=3072142 RepID=UPI00280E69AB|nr:FecR domain-containing protein [Hyphomicrobium sp. LHD-15]MDQ8700206.1 FecR domain-containing protein [Hyphomicrobium sp. LHD-15]
MAADREDLWNEAMALLLRWQSAPDDAELREAITAFSAQSDEHRAAWDDAKRLYRLTGEATGVSEHESKRKKARDVTRRNILTGVGAVTVGAGLIKGPELWRRWQADVTTEIGAIDVSRLPDGSRMTLGPDSAVQIAFSSSQRLVRLIEGMVLFDVAGGEGRPFVAQTGGLQAFANAGMSFEVRQNGGRSFVGSSSGNVAVESDEEASARKLLEGGDWMAVGPDRDARQQGHRQADQVAAWRQRLLVADQERIDTVVAEIARWQSARVIVAQPGLAASRVSGLYDLSDPTAALEAVVSPYGGRVRQITPWLSVLSTI